MQAKLVNRVSQERDVVGEQFGERFIPHSDVALALHRITERALDRAEQRLDIASSVVVIQILFFVQAEQVIHALVNSATPSRGIDPESQVGRAAAILYGLEVLVRRISFVAGNLIDGEIFGRCLNERGELRGIGRVLAVDDNTGHNVSRSANDGVSLDPSVFGDDAAPFLLVPTIKPTRGKARTV